MIKEDRMYHSENVSRTAQGENLYITTARNGSQLWYEEIGLYTYSPILSGENYFYEIRHYTQRVWNNTTKVGMAMALFQTQAKHM